MSSIKSNFPSYHVVDDFVVDRYRADLQYSAVINTADHAMQSMPSPACCDIECSSRYVQRVLPILLLLSALLLTTVLILSISCQYDTAIALNGWCCVSPSWQYFMVGTYLALCVSLSWNWSCCILPSSFTKRERMPTVKRHLQLCAQATVIALNTNITPVFRFICVIYYAPSQGPMY